MSADNSAESRYRFGLHRAREILALGVETRKQRIVAELHAIRGELCALARVESISGREGRAEARAARARAIEELAALCDPYLGADGSLESVLYHLEQLVLSVGPQELAATRAYGIAAALALRQAAQKRSG